MPKAAPWNLAGWVRPPALPGCPQVPAEDALGALRGRVVLLHAFQLGCAGCRERGLPQAERLHRLAVSGPLAGAPLTVIGLHTPFDPSEPAGPEARAAVAQWAAREGLEQALALDAPGDPGELGTRTFQAYRMAGTPTLCLIDGRGELRRLHLGPMDDLHLGTEIGLLLAEARRG